MKTPSFIAENASRIDEMPVLSREIAGNQDDVAASKEIAETDLLQSRSRISSVGSTCRTS